MYRFWQNPTDEATKVLKWTTSIPCSIVACRHTETMDLQATVLRVVLRWQPLCLPVRLDLDSNYRRVKFERARHVTLEQRCDAYYPQNGSQQSLDSEYLRIED